jgi:hypothetical protein
LRWLCEGEALAFRETDQHLGAVAVSHLAMLIAEAKLIAVSLKVATG